MCCTFEKSEMSNTRIYVGEAQKNGKLVHVLAYQNKAVSHGPNAMVIPFPTKEKMGPENVIDTRAFKHFLEDITEANRAITKGARLSRGLEAFGADGLAEVFDVGSYTVVLAQNVYQIPEALTRVPEKKRPDVRVNFLNGYAKLYPDQPVAMCCWDGSIEAEPLLWWYEPSDSSKLFIPTMDAHDGMAPKVGVEVHTDHHISVGMVRHGNLVRYQDSIPEGVKQLLPIFVEGTRLPTRLPNDDCFVKAAELNPDSPYKPVNLSRNDFNIKMHGWV